jgi:6-phosphogluconolactonase
MRGVAVLALVLGCSAEGGHATSAGSSSTAAGSTSSTIGAGSSSVADTTTTSTGAGSSDGEESSTGEPAPQRVMLYVTSGTVVHAWSVDIETGMLGAHVEKDLGVELGPLAHDAAGTRLWVARWGDDSLGTLAIDPQGGALAELDHIGVGGMMVYLTVDGPNAHVLAADYNGNEVSSWPLDADGIAAGPASTTLTVGTNPHSIVLAPAGDFAFVPNLMSGEVRQLVYDAADGSLLANDPDRVTGPAGVGPRHMIFADDARFAWVINESGDSITRWRYDAIAGQLSEPITVSTLPRGADGSNNYCADLHLALGGAFLYGSNRGADTLARFAVDPRDGTLVLLDETATEAAPRSFAIAIDDRFLYAGGRDSARLASYAIAADGSLAPLEILDAPTQPEWVEPVTLPPR